MTPPNEVNDVFEFTPTSSDASPVKLADAAEIHKLAGPLRERLAAKGKIFAGSDAEFREFLVNNAKEPVFASADQVRRMCKGVLDHISKVTGIICFSKRRNNLLMWSHYADGHKGIVIAFDVPPKLAPKRRSLEVRYSKRRYPWRFVSELTSDEFLDEVRNLVQTKSVHWRAEKEVRLLWSLEGLDQEVDDRTGRPIYFTRIPPEVISDVIFGYRCPRGIEEKVEAAIAANNLQVQRWCAEPSDAHFTLRFRAKP